jgi:hypothetical protein
MERKLFRGCSAWFAEDLVRERRDWGESACSVLNFLLKMRRVQERLGGSVVQRNDWRNAAYVFSDSAAKPMVGTIMSEEEDKMLVFHPNFVLDCIAQERIINGGPYIIQAETVVASEEEVDEEDPVVSVSETPQKRFQGKKRGPAPKESPDLQVSPAKAPSGRPPKRVRPRQISPLHPALGRERHLHDLGDPEELDELAAEFEDFVPNERGFVVRVVEQRG